ncbi:MAG: hypothetical protein ABFS03_08370, partial [Chloroflexota bacterium]
IYTTLPFAEHFPGWLEVMTQAFLLSLITFYWVRNSDKKWISWVMSILFVILLILPIMGLVFGSVGV